MSGSTAKDVSPIRPRVTLFTADWLTGSPSTGPTVVDQLGWLERLNEELTNDEDPIDKGKHGPDIWSPIGMTKTTREGEESFQQLLRLTMVHKGSQRGRKYDND